MKGLRTFSFFRWKFWGILKNAMEYTFRIGMGVIHLMTSFYSNVYLSFWRALKQLLEWGSPTTCKMLFSICYKYKVFYIM